MRANTQLTGMTGVYLVAAELSKRGFIVSLTSRSARGADLLVTNQSCTKTFAVQVKTNATTFGFWLFGQHAKKMKARALIYVLVNLRRDQTEFFVMPSATVARGICTSRKKRSTWYFHMREDALPYQNKWGIFGKP